MQIDNITTTDTPGEPQRAQETIKGQIDAQELKSPGNATEKPTEQNNLLYVVKILDRIREDRTGNTTERTPGGNISPGFNTDDKKDAESLKGQINAHRQPRTPTEYDARALVKLERQQSDLKRYKEACKQYQDNIKKSEMLRADINKSIRAGEDPTEILKKAVECIALMTGDKAYYTHAIKQLNEHQ